MKKQFLSVLLSLCMIIALIPTGTLAAESTAFAMQDFGIWGESWFGAHNVGWKYSEDFDTASLTGLEVGMKDAAGNLIIRYTADGEQLQFQKENGYITADGQSSAPFYKEYQGTPIAEGRDDDWTVEKGPAFDKWDVSTCYVTVTTAEGSYTAKNVSSHTHAYTAEEVNDVALKSEATTESAAVYYKTCPACGAISSNDADTFSYGSPLPEHNGGGGGGSAVIDYEVTVKESVNGAVKVSTVRAEKEDIITISITPDTGYKLERLTVSDKNGAAVEITDKGDGKYTFVMPASAVVVEAVFVAEVQESMPFADVPSEAWYYDAVEYVFQNGLMNGTSAVRFSPEANTTRGMIVTMLYRLEGSPAASGTAFADVAAGQYYADAVAWAASHDIVKGYDSQTFGPDDSITREQMAAILYRYAQYKGYDVTERADLSAFTDAAQIAPYAVEAMQWANAKDIIRGISDTILDPQGNAVRAQVAALFMRFCENTAK